VALAGLAIGVIAAGGGGLALASISPASWRTMVGSSTPGLGEDPAARGAGEPGSCPSIISACSMGVASASGVGSGTAATGAGRSLALGGITAGGAGLPLSPISLASRRTMVGSSTPGLGEDPAARGAGEPGSCPSIISACSMGVASDASGVGTGTAATDAWRSLA